MGEHETEDLSDNPFYKALTGHFKKYYTQVCNKRLLVCIPRKTSLAGVKLSKSHFETHLLRPSRYIKSQYHSLNGKVIDYSEGFVTVRKGFATPGRRIRVLFEDRFYTPDFQPFNVMCLEEPLESVRAARGADAPSASVQLELGGRKTLEEFVELLGFDQPSRVRAQIDAEIEEFRSAYVLVKGYLSDAGNKLGGIIRSGARLLAVKEPRFSSCRLDSQSFSELEVAVECYVLSRVFHKLRRSLAEIQGDDIRQLDAGKSAMAAAQSAGMSELPLPLLNAAAASAKAIWAPLAGLRTSFERLLALDHAVEALSGLAAVHMQEGQGGTGGQVSSDDLLPLMISTIVKSDVSASDLVMSVTLMKDFHFGDVCDSRHGFNLATLEAAIEFIRSKGRPRPFSERALWMGSGSQIVGAAGGGNAAPADVERSPLAIEYPGTPKESAGIGQPSAGSAGSGAPPASGHKQGAPQQARLASARAYVESVRGRRGAAHQRGGPRLPIRFVRKPPEVIDLSGPAPSGENGIADVLNGEEGGFSDSSKYIL